METLLEQVKKFYEAVQALPEPSPRFNNLEWLEMHGGPYGGVYKDAKSIREGVFDRLDRDWHDFVLTPQTFLEAGQAVVVIGTYIGTNKLTGKVLSARVVHLWQQKNEKLYFEQFTDTALFLMAMKQ